jgi:hypothetical protein
MSSQGLLLKVFAQVFASCDELSFFLILMSFEDVGRRIGAGQFLTISANHFIHISSYFLSQLATPSSTTLLRPVFTWHSKPAHSIMEIGQPAAGLIPI